jgi:phenylacetate-CoA ligase
MSSSFAYRHSPTWAQELFISAKSSLRSLMREGRAFEALSAEVHESEWWSERELRDFQSRKLRMIVESAARNVPYYRDRYRPLDLDFKKLEFPGAIAKLPLISKTDVREGGRALISERKRGPLFSGSTSGTSGAPLGLYQDLPAINRENAFIWRQLAWAGLRRGDRRAWMRGDMIVPATQEKPPYWRLNRAENMLMLSSYHLSESAAPAYLDSLARFDPVVIQAYPSSIGFLATWMLSISFRYRGIALRGIVTSSETLSDVRRGEIERAFGCRVFDWYGQFERVAAIGTCEHGRHHLLSDYSFVEMLPAEDGMFELVGTGFNNAAMPLIRYRCGDLVRPAPSYERCACGRSFPLIEEIVGRVDDSIRLPGGRSIGRLDHLFKGVEGILEAQIRQDRLDVLTILVVPSGTFNDRTRETLESNARYRLGDAITVEIRLVDAIPRTQNGKFKGVICNVSAAGTDRSSNASPGEQR